MNPIEKFLLRRNGAAQDAANAPGSETKRLTEGNPSTAPAEDWWVKVRDAAYGPYPRAQLMKFIEEGRVRPNTNIALAKEGPWKEARAFSELYVQPRSAEGEAAMTTELANLFVYAEIHSGAWTPFMAALETLGKITEIAPGFWIVRTHRSVGVMRNTLSQTLERGDKFVVIDATHDRLAWFNLGPEVDARIKEVWNAKGVRK